MHLLTTSNFTNKKLHIENNNVKIRIVLTPRACVQIQGRHGDILALSGLVAVVSQGNDENVYRPFYPGR